MAETFDKPMPEPAVAPLAVAAPEEAQDEAVYNVHPLDLMAAFLLLFAALNWGLVGLFDLDLVNAAFGAASGFARGVHTTMGLAALYAVYTIVRFLKGP